MTAPATSQRAADQMLVDTVNRLYTEHCTPERINAAERSQDGMDAAVWEASWEMGLTAIGVAESLGGSGGTLHDAAAVCVATGYHAVPAPVADVLASALLGSLHGLPVASAARSSEGIVVPVVAGRIGWASVASSLLTSEGIVDRATVVDPSSVGRTYAGEPYGLAPSVRPLEHADAVVALVRALQLAGGLQRVSELCVQYALEREQFGKPIGRQQILQHYLAQLAGDAAAAQAAADNAVDVWAKEGVGPRFRSAVAAAKTVAGLAVAPTNKLAHQLHGAIGFTDEHRLQFWTRRLWAWRDDAGTEAQWAAELGRSVVAAGGRPALWDFITALPPSAR